MSLSVSLSNSHVWRQLPLLTPALKKDSCAVDNDLLISRVYIFGTAAIFIGLSALVLPASLSATAIASACILAGSLGIDYWRTERAANIKAVNEYLKLPTPSESALLRICTTFNAAKLLINKHGDLNKIIHSNGAKLLNYAIDLKIFKLFIDNGADIKAIGHYGNSIFEETVYNTNPSRLEYVLKHRKVKPQDFSPKQQIKFWTDVGSVKTAHLLKQYGFDVNIQDHQGYTPLLEIVKDASSPSTLSMLSSSLRKLDVVTHVKTLMDCGADPLMTVVEGNTRKNAIQINTNPALYNILQRV